MTTAASASAAAAAAAESTKELRNLRSLSFAARILFFFFFFFRLFLITPSLYLLLRCCCCFQFSPLLHYCIDILLESALLLPLMTALFMTPNNCSSFCSAITIISLRPPHRFPFPFIAASDSMKRKKRVIEKNEEEKKNGTSSSIDSKRSLFPFSLLFCSVHD